MTARTLGWAAVGAATGLLLPWAIAMTGAFSAFGHGTSYETVLGYMFAGAVGGGISGAVAAWRTSARK
jgi:hypothetical protein